MSKNIWKSVGSIATGTVLGIILSIGTDMVLEKTGVFPPFAEQMAHGLWIGWMLALATFYRCAYTALGGYVAAKLAPEKPQFHANILGALATLANLIGLIATWGKGLGPEWYPIALTVLAFPSAWAGGLQFRR